MTAEKEIPEAFTPTAEQAERAAQAQNDPTQNLTVEQATQTMRLLKARAETETAEYQKRLIMQQFRPCKLYPVIVYHDGLRWVCSYGVFGDQYRDYLPEGALGQSGVEAYGTSPEDAMSNFDSMWIGGIEEDDNEEDEDYDESDSYDD